MLSADSLIVYISAFMTRDTLRNLTAPGRLVLPVDSLTVNTSVFMDNGHAANIPDVRELRHHPPQGLLRGVLVQDIPCPPCSSKTARTVPPKLESRAQVYLDDETNRVLAARQLWQSHQHKTLVQLMIGVHTQVILVNVRLSCRGKNKLCCLEKRSIGRVDRQHEHHLTDPGREHGLRSRSSACTCQLADQAPVFGLWAKYLGVKVSGEKLPFASVVHLSRDAKV